MTDTHTADPLADLPEAQLEEPRGLSLIWLVPIIAALIGGWLAYKVISEKGPTIHIQFSQAAGVEAGKTRIRYKDVEIGKVKNIGLSADLSQVEITAELDKSLAHHLSDNTRFWIVQPRISTKGISGLSTLISGIYIAMDPGEGGGEAPAVFEGLDTPPLLESDQQGSSFHLVAENLGGLEIGAPVFYRQIEVGEVIHYSLDESGHSVSISVFIRAPYDSLVRSNTRFWNVTGVDLQFTPKGVTARIESIEALIAGGIAFATPHNLSAGTPSKEGDYFPLFPNYAATNERPYTLTQYFIMYFDSSVRGLDVDAPVEFRGMKVGEVVDIELRVDSDSLDAKIPVLVGLHPELIFQDEKLKDPADMLERLVDHGLRAQLQSGNLITGQLFIDLDFLEDAPAAKITPEDPYLVFPTVPGDLEKITRNLSDLLNKVGEMPLLEITQELETSIQGLNRFLAAAASPQALADLTALLSNTRSMTEHLDSSLSPLSEQLLATLNQVQLTLADTQSILNEDSPLYYDVRQLIEEMSSAVRAFEALTELLERNPNALLYGKKPK